MNGESPVSEDEFHSKNSFTKMDAERNIIRGRRAKCVKINISLRCFPENYRAIS